MLLHQPPAAKGTAGAEYPQLRAEFVEVERAGIALAAGLTKVGERIAFVFDLIETQDWSASVERLEERLRNVDKIYGDMFADTYQPRETLDGLADSASQAATELQKTGDTGAAAAQKIRDEFAGLDLTTASGIKAFTDQITAASGKASLLTEELKKWISETNAADLTAFQTGLVEAFNAGQLSAEKLSEYNTLVLRQSFDSLGISAEAALGKISPAADDAITQISLIRDTLLSMGTDGEQAMGALEIAIRGAVGKADTTAAVDALRQKVTELGDAGELRHQSQRHGYHLPVHPAVSERPD